MKILPRIGLFLAVLPLLLPSGCGSKQPVPTKSISEKEWFIQVPTEPIHGKMTYQGKPVPFGVMFFYNQKSETKDGMLPVGNAVIKDGSYKGVAPAGPVAVCVITNREVLKKGGPPSVDGRIGRVDPKELGDRKGMGGPPAAGSKGAALAREHGPLGPDGHPVKRGKPKELEELEAKKAKRFDDMKFTEQEIKMLKEIQDKYGTFTTQEPLFITISQGEQTQDIDLK